MWEPKNEHNPYFAQTSQHFKNNSTSPGYASKTTCFSEGFAGVTNLLTPTHSHGRPPPLKVSRLKKLLVGAVSVTELIGWWPQSVSVMALESRAELKRRTTIL